MLPVVYFEPIEEFQNLLERAEDKEENDFYLTVLDYCKILESSVRVHFPIRHDYVDSIFAFVVCEIGILLTK